MANLRLIQYIEKELAKNFPRDQIKQVLIKYNYKEEEIDEAFKYIDEKNEGKKPEVTNDAVLAQAMPKKKHFGLIMATIMLVIAIAYTIFWFADDKIEGPVLVFNDSELKKVEPLPFKIPGSEHTYFEGLVDTCIRKYMSEEDAETITSCIYLAKDENCEGECAGWRGLLGAVQGKGKAWCQSITDDDFRAACHFIVDQDAEKCSFFQDSSDLSLCRAYVLRDKAQCVGYEDPEHCEGRVDELLAVSANNPDACKSIKSSLLRAECLAVVREDYRECYQLTRCSDDSYRSIATQQMNPQICESIWDDETKANCKSIAQP